MITDIVIPESHHIIRKDDGAQPRQGCTQLLLLLLETAVRMVEMPMRRKDTRHRRRRVRRTVKIAGKIITGQGLNGDILYAISFLLMRTRSDNREGPARHML